VKTKYLFVLLPAVISITSCTPEDKACLEMVVGGLRPVATDRADRFNGKVAKATAFCRGGQHAVDFMSFPWVDWGNYYAAGDASSRAPGDTGNAPLSPNGVGVGGALLDLEYQRIELIKFNLFDNNGTFRTYLLGKNHEAGPAVKSWESMRLPKDDANYARVGGDAPQQVCTGDLIRKRTLTGICNDLLNPLMGSTNQLFARNVEFEATFPEKALNELTRNRHGDRIGLMKPDPQVISRRLFTRVQSNPDACRAGQGAADPAASNCDYQKAPFFNVLAAFWIQFMTHDWFSHMEEGHNASEYEKTGCATKLVNNREEPLSTEDIARLGCRPDDLIDSPYIAQNTPPGLFTRPGSDRQYMDRAPQTMRNTNTAWWDASQIYGYDDVSVKRVKRDPADRAKLLLTPLPGKSAADGLYLPLLAASDPMNPQWAGQEATAFPDNWTIGISFLTNLFAREHDAFVDEFRKQAGLTPSADCGLRNPSEPAKAIRYQDVTPDELYDAARLVVSAEIAKIHTIEWTPQLLYDEPLYEAMNANWNGLIGSSNAELTKILQHVVKTFGKSKDADFVTTWYSAFASGPGIVGMGSRDRHWDITKTASVNGGVNHFGSPFNFPEEFISVYRLHPLVPDLLEYRDLKGDPNTIVEKVPVIETFRAKATDMRARGMGNWALTIGRQRLGLLTLRNEPMFLQNLSMPRLDSPTKEIDVAALDLLRDREHGVPRFNEFRRQYGLRQLASFDDFIDPDPNLSAADRREQEDRSRTLRELYGQHVCDDSKKITDAQKNVDGSPITDCLGKPNGTLVDNIEDVDTIVGYLAENRRPHGFAISETQFVVFILNASRRLFSDRFLTSSFRPEFYTTMGLNWVNNNGPGDPVMEKGMPNGHTQPVSPLKRVLLRTIPELAPELANVVNAFDPWARARGEYYTIDWKPRAGAESDDAFKQK
jgi:heme peroxidase